MPLDSIDLSARLIFGACALALLGVIIALIRRNVIREKYAILWLPLGAGFLVAGLFPELLVRLSARIHLHYITVVVLGIIVVFAAILLYFTARLSQMREDIKSLAQALALERADRKAEAAAGARRESGPMPRTPGDGAPDAEPGWLPAGERPESRRDT
jgi:hypothetical protein